MMVAPDAWILALPDAVFADCVGPDWSRMTDSERAAYGPPAEIPRRGRSRQDPVPKSARSPRAARRRLQWVGGRVQ